MNTRPGKLLEKLSLNLSQNDLIVYIEAVKHARKKIGRTIIGLLDMKQNLLDVFVIKKAKCFEIKGAVGDKFIIQ